MNDPNDSYSSEGQANTDETEISQPSAEEQPVAHIAPLVPGESAQESLTRPASFVPREMAGEDMGMVAVPQVTTAYEHFGDATEATPNPIVPVPAPAIPPTMPAQNLPPNPSYQPATPEIIFTQPGYPQHTSQLAPGQFQPGLPITAMPPKKRRTGLWVALIIIVALLLGSGTALAIVASQRPTNTPTQALQTFCHSYKTLNAQELYSILSSASQKGTSLAQIRQSFDELRRLSNFARISDCTVSNVQQKDATATGLVTLTESISFDGSSTSVAVPLSMALVLENNTWKVDTSQMNSNLTGPNFLTPTVPGASNQ